MHEEAGLLAHVGDGDAGAVGFEGAGVADLAAGFGVEGRLVQHDLHLDADRRSLDGMAADEEGGDLAFGGLGVVAEELGGAELLGEVEPDRLVGGLAGAGPGGAGLRLLLGHRRLEAGDVDGAVLLAERVLGEVEREAEGVVEAEGGGAGERGAVGQAVELVVEDAQAAVERGLEAGLLGEQRLLDQRLGAGELGEGGAHLGDQRRDQAVHHRIHGAEQVRVAHGAAHDAAEHVAAAFVGGEHAVGDQEGGGAQVVGDHPVVDAPCAVRVGMWWRLPRLRSGRASGRCRSCRACPAARRRCARGPCRCRSRGAGAGCGRRPRTARTA